MLGTRKSSLNKVVVAIADIGISGISSQIFQVLSFYSFSRMRGFPKDHFFIVPLGGSLLHITSLEFHLN